MSELIVFEPLFYAVAIPAVIATGISKSGLGGGTVFASVLHGASSSKFGQRHANRGTCLESFTNRL